MTPEDKQFIEDAKSYIRANRTEISRRLTDITRYPQEDMPVSVFMAGSPGAGKTETSKAYLKQLEEVNEKGEVTFEVLRIDPDEYRSLIPRYTGANSWLVQPAVSLLVERVIDNALRRRCCINQFQGELPQTQPWLCHGRRLRTAQFCKSI